MVYGFKDKLNLVNKIRFSVAMLVKIEMRLTNMSKRMLIGTLFLFFYFYPISAARRLNGQAHLRRRDVRYLWVKFLEIVASENSSPFSNAWGKFLNSA